MKEKEKMNIIKKYISYIFNEVKYIIIIKDKNKLMFLINE